MSETKNIKHLVSDFCVGLGIDIGCGGDPVAPDVLRFDLKTPYTQENNYPAQFILKEKPILYYINNNSLDYIYSSHLIEDFFYEELKVIIADWFRALKVSGKLILCAPDQKEYIRHNEEVLGINRFDHRVNQAHKEQDFSIDTFINNVLSHISIQYNTILSIPSIKPYSWILILEKL
jgi:predicted SAM-dependent methyltransferase